MTSQALLKLLFKRLKKLDKDQRAKFLFEAIVILFSILRNVTNDKLADQLLKELQENKADPLDILRKAPSVALWETIGDAEDK